jgi:hypothetical protein
MDVTIFRPQKCDAFDRYQILADAAFMLHRSREAIAILSQGRAQMIGVCVNRRSIAEPISSPALDIPSE